MGSALSCLSSSEYSGSAPAKPSLAAAAEPPPQRAHGASAGASAVAHRQADRAAAQHHLQTAPSGNASDCGSGPESSSVSGAGFRPGSRLTSPQSSRHAADAPQDQGRLPLGSGNYNGTGLQLQVCGVTRPSCSPSKHERIWA